MKRLLVLFSLFFVMSCSTTAYVEKVFIVQREVPENPVFTVIPLTYDQNQRYYADMFEETLISFQIKTVAPPTLKEVETKKQAGLAGVAVETDNASAGLAEEEITERYFSYDSINADYVMQTNAITQRVKIVKRSTLEVLASFSLDLPKETGYDRNSYSNQLVRYRFRKAIHEALSGIGLELPAIEDEPVAPKLQRYIE